MTDPTEIVVRLRVIEAGRRALPTATDEQLRAVYLAMDEEVAQPPQLLRDLQAAKILLSDLSKEEVLALLEPVFRFPKPFDNWLNQRVFDGKTKLDKHGAGLIINALNSYWTEWEK